MGLERGSAAVRRLVSGEHLSPQLRAAAARAGVDLTSRASIDAADRRYERLAAAQ